MKFIKRDTDFFELFDGMGKNLIQASVKLVAFLSKRFMTLSTTMICSPMK
ncbi:MAG: hypothetical protein H6Q48_309 [Deltaproteobacteria bacterium]|nr:hypothetical protein [Deltaproteobacteria bacterium]